MSSFSFFFFNPNQPTTALASGEEPWSTIRCAPVSTKDTKGPIVDQGKLSRLEVGNHMFKVLAYQKLAKPDDVKKRQFNFI